MVYKQSPFQPQVKFRVKFGIDNCERRVSNVYTEFFRAPMRFPVKACPNPLKPQETEKPEKSNLLKEESDFARALPMKPSEL